MNERKDLAKEFKDLQNHYNSNEDIRDKIESIKCDIECKTTQINDIQKIMLEGFMG